MQDNPYATAASLIDILEKGQAKDFPYANKKKEYADRYKELDRYFAEVPVEMGAMKKEIEIWRENLIEASKIKNNDERTEVLDRLLDEDPVIFLNKHGTDHVNRVRDKAFEIVKCFTRDEPSFYELFFLLCSISVHDIGNFFGRTDHEKRIYPMLEKACKNIIDDTVEIKVISRIAGAHGGRIRGNKDTISFLKKTDTINNFTVREQVLAAVVRFADELADDSTRAVYPAIESGILGATSEIYHVYSSKLHTVKLEQNPITAAWEVVLKFAIDEDTAKKQFSKGTKKVYLLDEIYERTMKMERERRYCMRFLRLYCSIESINVEIAIESNDNVFDQKIIKYELQEEGYPDIQYKSIKDINDELLTGEEMAEELSGQNQGEKDE